MAEPEPRRTIAFDSFQWRSVIRADLQRLHEIIGNVGQPNTAFSGPMNDATLTTIGGALDKIGTMIGAMNLCLTKEAADAQAAQAAAQQPQVQAPVANGNAQPAPVQSAEPQVVPITKKKGGWPAGKPRGKRKAQVAQ